MTMLRVLAVAFALSSLALLSGCGPDLATDPTDPADPTEPTDESGDGTGTTIDALITGTWDATMMVPKCASVSNGCTTGGSLVSGRGNIGPEPHQPNTLFNSCADGQSGSFHFDESVDQITISTLDATNFAVGKDVRVDVRVWAYSPPDSDALDVYYASNANSPVWTLIDTVTPTVAGGQTLSLLYQVPGGGGALHAVRAVYRYGGVTQPCSDGDYDDHDDLVFAVGAVDTTPPNVTLTAPLNGATVSGTINLSATASDNLGVARVEFYVDGVFKGQDTLSPYSISFNTTTVANGSHNVKAKAVDGTGNYRWSGIAYITVNNINPPQLVVNGGFEGSLSPWVPVGTVAWTNTGGAHGGTGLVKFAGADNVTSAALYEQIAIPSAAPANLTFWLNVETGEDTLTAYDNFYVEVRNTSNVLLATLGTFSNMDKTSPGAYVQKGFSMASWRGQTIRLRFRATTDSSYPTTFRIDDVSLK